MYSPRVLLLLAALVLEVVSVSGQNCLMTSDCPEYAMCFVHICRCNKGFRRLGAKCVDIDECLLRNSCGANALCENLIGGFSCSCKPGFNGNGKECIDFDECNSERRFCERSESCQNYPGSFKCLCNGKVCHGAAYCSDNMGVVECICGDGFIGDGSYCVDIDECYHQMHNCTEGSTCINTEGGFECKKNSVASLQSGFAAHTFAFLIWVYFYFGTT